MHNCHISIWHICLLVLVFIFVIFLVTGVNMPLTPLQKYLCLHTCWDNLYFVNFWLSFCSFYAYAVVYWYICTFFHHTGGWKWEWQNVISTVYNARCSASCSSASTNTNAVNTFQTLSGVLCGKETSWSPLLLWNVPRTTRSLPWTLLSGVPS